MHLTDEEQDRYARHIAMPSIDEAGQLKLKAASVLIVGIGGLGSPASFYLAAAGVGKIGLLDHDIVELSNLQRQIIHSTNDLNKPKVHSAKQKLSELNPNVHIEAYDRRLTADNASEIFRGYDFVVDGSDNFPTKFLIAETCHLLKIAYSHAGIDEFIGQTLTVIPGETACCRCIFDLLPEPDEVKRGPIGFLPGVIGTIQAGEAIKYILGQGKLLTDRLLVFDAQNSMLRTIPVRRNQKCLLCGSSTQDEC
ncbi:MAG: HesA/MoeB/ThiF family protein [Lentisphaerae bacterium]|nr:HesA/MoeB/ThiF family protein [Lentisphaerota bacterium]